MLCSQIQMRDRLYNYYDGLPSDNIHFTTKSKKGYLFIVNPQGLTSFDGYRFLSSEHITGGIVSQFVKMDTLFFEDLHALRKVSLKSINEKPLTIKTKVLTDDNPNNDHFKNIFIDSQNRIWCTDFNQIKYIDANFKVKSYPVFETSNKNILNVYFTQIKKNEIWAATSNGILVWKNNKLIKHQHSELATASVLAANKTASDVFIFSTNNEIVLFDIKLNQIIQKIKQPNIKNVSVFGGTIFFCDDYHVYRYNNLSKNLEKIYTSSYVINHLMFDKDTNQFWISTKNGLLKIIQPKAGINTFFFNDNSTIISIANQGNVIFAVTNTGAFWKFESNIWNKIDYPDKSIAQRVDVVNNRVLISTNSGVLEFKNNSFYPLHLEKFPIGKIVKKIFATPANELWLVFENDKIHRYNLSTFAFISNTFTNKTGFWNDNLWNDAIVTKNNKIWLVGWMPKGFGINIYDANTNLFTDISSDKSINPNQGIFVGDYYHDVYETENGDLLFSAFGGFNIGNSSGKIYKRIDVNSHQIHDTYLKGISEHDEHIFFSTSEGLHVYNEKTDDVVRLTKADGLPTNMLTNAYTVLNNETIALGIEGGMVLVNTKKVLKTELINKIDISHISVNGKTRFIDSDYFELTKDDHDVTVYFSDLSFLDHFKVGYRYKINNSDWIDLKHQAELVFNKVNPGDYKVEIQVYDHLNNIQKKVLHFGFKAHPPFTKSLPFYIIIGLSLLILVIGVNWYLLKRKQKEDALLNRIKDAEMETLRSQMNPHFMFNTLNSINSYIVQNKTKDASKYLTSFSKLMRNILENSKQTNITIAKEIQTLKLYIDLELVRLEHFFTYEIIVDDVIDTEHFLVPPLIIQPFVENAIWHGLKERNTNACIIIKFNQIDENTVQITVEDNGIGRKKSAELKTNKTSHKSYGVSITTDRLQMINQENSIEIIDLYDNDNMPIGTKIVLTLKVNNHD